METYYGPVTKDPNEIFNFCTKYLVRDNYDTAVNEGWRFPLVMTILHDDKMAAKYNEVTFIYHNKEEIAIDNIQIIGSFIPLYKTMPLEPVMYDGEETDFYYVTLKLPIGKGYFYKFRVNGEDQLDPINPQKIKLNNGKEWSFFFTDFYNYSVDFEEWEMNLLYRMVEEIVPLRTEDAQNFINRFYEGQTKQEKSQMPIHRLGESVGEVNYITNILAREERHHLNDYKICISIIDQILRKRNPYVNSWEVSSELIKELYEEMASGHVPDWNYARYQDPQHFLKMLRRHCIIGTFCHPKYGGNVGCAGWNYLKERYSMKDEAGRVIGSYFNWDLAMERPFGINQHYKG